MVLQHKQFIVVFVDCGGTAKWCVCGIIACYRGERVAYSGVEG